MTLYSIRSLTCGGLVVAAALMSSCAATHVSEVTKESSYNPRGMHRVLVIAVVRKPATQHMLEDEFVRLLKKREVEGVASYTIVPEGTKLDEAAWKKLVADQHFDSVIATSLVSMEVIDKDVDAKYMNQPGQMGSYGYYNMSYAAMYQPGFSYRKETAAVETRVFDAATEKQVWSAKSKTDIEQGRDPAAQVRDFAGLMMGKIYR